MHKLRHIMTTEGETLAHVIPRIIVVVEDDRLPTDNDITSSKREQNHAASDENIVSWSYSDDD